MKKYLLQFVLVLAVTFSFNMVIGQSLVLTNYTLSSTSPDALNPIEATLTVHNQSANMVIAQVRRTVQYLVPGSPIGHEESFCFGPTCYAPGTDVSTDPDTIMPGADDNTFIAHITPNNICGTTYIHYRFYDQNNPNDSVGIDLSFGFCTASGLNELSLINGVSKPTHNPADDFTSFRFNLNDNEKASRIVIYNMLGSLIKSMPLQGKSGELFVNTSSLKQGLYLCSVVKNNVVTNTYKLVVAHK